MNIAWYVLRTKARKESLVEADLSQRGFETFCPTIAVKPVNPRASKIQPYFPCYLFVRVDLKEVGINTLRWVPGAANLVQFDGYLATVPDAVIERLRRHIGRLRAASARAGAHDDFVSHLRRGDPVKIARGPLAGYEAIFDARLSGSERVQVLLHMLGRIVRAQVNTDAIEKRSTGTR